MKKRVNMIVKYKQDLKITSSKTENSVTYTLGIGECVRLGAVPIPRHLETGPYYLPVSSVRCAELETPKINSSTKFIKIGIVQGKTFNIG